MLNSGHESSSSGMHPIWHDGHNKFCHSFCRPSFCHRKSSVLLRNGRRQEPSSVKNFIGYTMWNFTAGKIKIIIIIIYNFTTHHIFIMHIITFAQHMDIVNYRVVVDMWITLWFNRIPWSCKILTKQCGLNAPLMPMTRQCHMHLTEVQALGIMKAVVSL